MCGCRSATGRSRRVVTDVPDSLVVGLGRVVVMLAIVDHQLEEPVGAHREVLRVGARRGVPVKHALQVSAGATARAGAVALVCQPRVHAREVFGHLAEEDRVALLFVTLAEEPAEHDRRPRSPRARPVGSEPGAVSGRTKRSWPRQSRCRRRTRSQKRLSRARRPGRRQERSATWSS